MVISALESTELALESGLRHDQIIISCKTSRPRDLITVYRDLSAKTEQPLHLGLTEAGMGMKGQIWSAASLGILLYEGIGDTIRISLTPNRTATGAKKFTPACELLQALGLRSFAPSVTACPGCGRTTSTTFQELAESVPGLHPGHDAHLEDAIMKGVEEILAGKVMRPAIRETARRISDRPPRIDACPPLPCVY